MKRTALKTRTPLKRRTRLRTRRSMLRRSPKRAQTSPEDRSRLDWLHSLPCCAPGAPSGCRGRATVHHDTQDHAKGKKAPHDRGIPMCYGHHIFDFHNNLGPFAGWTGARRRAWQTAMVERYRALYAAHLLAKNSRSGNGPGPATIEVQQP